MPVGLAQALNRIASIEARFAARVQTNAPIENTLGVQSNVGETSIKPSKATSFDELIQHFANQNELPVDLVKNVVKTESGFNPNAVSKAGAMGLMQLMPQTAESLGVQNPMDPVQNLAGGTKYLKSLVDRFHSLPHAVAAYNAGPGAVEKFGGIPPYPETQNYVKKVLSDLP